MEVLIEFIETKQRKLYENIVFIEPDPDNNTIELIDKNTEYAIVDLEHSRIIHIREE